MPENSHPINDLMDTTMDRIREIVDANTIVGQPIRTEDGVTLIPVSRLSFGFASGGSDFTTKNQKPDGKNSFGGGSGAGVNIVPVAFVVVKDGYVRLLPVSSTANTTADRVVEMVPEILDKVGEFMDKKKTPEDSAPQE